MKVEKDYYRHSYKITYVVGKEMIVSYLDFTSSQEEYEEWIMRHTSYIRSRVLDILTGEDKIPT